MKLKVCIKGIIHDKIIDNMYDVIIVCDKLLILGGISRYEMITYGGFRYIACYSPCSYIGSVGMKAV